MKSESPFKPISGSLMLVVALILLLTSVYLIINSYFPVGILLAVIWVFTLPGFMIINPNESTVLILFRKYNGTAKLNGFFWVNPFYVRKQISLKARNLNGTPLKVNDKIGNPIEIAAVIVWQVQNTFKAAFEVDDYIQYVKI